MLSLAIATVLGFQQQTITFKSNFEPLGKVVERISAETQIPMAAFGDLKGYPVYINVKDVSVRELLEKLADVAGAEWEKKDNSYYLTADSSVRNQQEKKGDADLIAAIEATITQAPPERKKIDFEAIAKKGENNPQEAMKFVGEIFGQMFQADEGTMEMLRIIGSKDLSSIVEGRRVVLSSTPTQMQGLLPAKATNAIRAYMKKLAAEAGNKNKEQDANPMDFLAMFGGGAGLQHPELVNQVNTVQAAFQIQNHTTLDVTLSAFTSEGKGVYTRTVQLPFVNPELARPRVKGTTKLEVAQMAKDYAQALADGKDIDPFISMAMSAQSGMANAMSMFMGENSPLTRQPNNRPISNQIRDIMRDPVKNEPLAFLFGPLLDVESAKGKNVVAMPSDEIVQILATQLMADGATVEGVLDEVDRSLSQKVTTDGTWEIVKASSPLEFRSAFCKRDALAELIRVGLPKGYVNLDDCSRFATKQGSARGSELLALPLITTVFKTSDIGSATALTHFGFDSLKLYATLTDFQKQALSSKRPVPLASLTPGQVDILARMVYNGPMPPMKADNDMIEEFSKMGQDGEENGMGAMMGIGMAMAGPIMSAMGMGENSMDNERTVLLPTGIPVAGAIQLHSSTMSGLLATDAATGNNTITVPELMGVMDMEIPGFQMPKRQYSSYKLVKQTSHLLMFQLGKGVMFMTSLYDVSVDDSKTYTKDQLPKDMQDRMNMMEKAREAAKAVPPKDVPPTP